MPLARASSTRVAACAAWPVVDGRGVQVLLPAGRNLPTPLLLPLPLLPLFGLAEDGALAPAGLTFPCWPGASFVCVAAATGLGVGVAAGAFTDGCGVVALVRVPLVRGAGGHQTSSSCRGNDHYSKGRPLVLFSSSAHATPHPSRGRSQHVRS